MFSRIARSRRTLSLSALDSLSRSASADRRLEALVRIREQTAEGGVRRGYLAIARRLIGDADDDCRWQALIVAGEFIPSEPEAVWQLVRRYGSSDDRDMRAAVATILLEHLLERRRARYRRLVEAEIRKGNRQLEDTFARCWTFARPGQP
jgi:hypothetical protein